jgi:hypothetical protein
LLAKQLRADSSCGVTLSIAHSKTKVGKHIHGLHHRLCIHVMVDRLTKFAHFFAISSEYKAAHLTELFFREVFRLHELLTKLQETHPPYSPPPRNEAKRRYDRETSSIVLYGVSRFGNVVSHIIRCFPIWKRRTVRSTTFPSRTGPYARVSGVLEAN